MTFIQTHAELRVTINPGFVPLPVASAVNFMFVSKTQKLESGHILCIFSHRRAPVVPRGQADNQSNLKIEEAEEIFDKLHSFPESRVRVA